jgi:hypothetical protein
MTTSPSLRPPAVPLICHDPYFSVWSFSDKLTDDWTHHWTGANHTSFGMARIDGKPYRWLGMSPDVALMDQRNLQIFPTRTIYTFVAAGIELTVTFLTPALPDDLMVLSRPVTYVSWDARSLDGKAHDVSVYFAIQADWAVDQIGQQVEWGRHKLEGLSVLRTGSLDQKPVNRSGDNLRIDWGYLYLATPTGFEHHDEIGHAGLLRDSFAKHGRLPGNDDLNMPRTVLESWPVLATVIDLGRVAKGKCRSGHVLVAYDDRFSIEYLHQRLRPYWRKDGAEAADLLRIAAKEYPKLQKRCLAFDKAILADARKVGGQDFADLCALAHRQCLAAHKLAADANGTPLLFSKENFSNGCIATVDVTYPSAPFFLLLNPELLKGMLTPIMDYAKSPRWKFPFAPHDLGQYPLANGQVYGGGERDEHDQMPVEECGNMLILLGALAHIEGNAEYARNYWPVLSLWANYLKEKGLDPEKQLCTDDFAGHLGHNTNLSLKAIVALGAFAQIAKMLGETKDAKVYRSAAEKMARQWDRMADDGDHYRLTFDGPGTWSQKYNLVWDRLLGLKLFPPSVARKELAYYKQKQQRFGLPLDSRKTYTKLDWIVWTATLTGERADLDALIKPIRKWLHQTPTRVPMTDWYETTDGRQVGFQARSVVGGVFIPFLGDMKLWKKWAR